MKKSAKKRYGIVWDFDDVLFDTARFKRQVADVLARAGYARAEVLQTVAIAKDANGYSPAIHASMLTADSRDAKRVAETIRHLLRTHGRSFIWPDAKRLLPALRARRVPMYLLSAGNPEFQKLKIDASGLKTYFKKVEIVSITGHDGAGKTKVRIVKKILRNHPTLLFIDDRPKNISAIARESSFRGRVIPLLIRRPDSQLTLTALRKAAPTFSI